MIRTELDVIDHVVRGAINTALLNLQLLATSLTPDDRTAPLDRARVEIRRVAEELLPAALGVIALERTQSRSVDLRGLVEDTLAQHSLDRVLLVAGPSAVVCGDPDLLALAVVHLARNALAATPEGAAAPRIELSVAGGEVMLLVRNACGGSTPPVFAGSIPGRRGHIGGLVAVSRIARLHGGTLTYEAAAGGLSARLALQASADPAGAAPRPDPLKAG